MADKSLQALATKITQLAEDTNKSIKPDVHSIKEAVCGTQGILESIVYISKQLDKLQKKNTIDKLTTKSSTNTNKNLIRKTDKISNTLNKILDYVKSMSGRGTRVSRLNNDRPDNRKLKEYKSISQSIDIIEKLRNINIKDFIFAKMKIKNIKNMMSRFLATFKMFKNQKEIDGTLNLASSSIEIMKKLSKVYKISIPAKLGAKAIQTIFLGGKKDKHGGLLGLFRKISLNEIHIKRGKKSLKDMLASCGSMLISSIVLTGIAVVSIPAMLGALAMKGIVWLMVGTYKVLSKAHKHVVKGSLVLLIMSASVISFALGLGLMVKAVKDMKLKHIGLMIASIAGIGLTVAGVGLLAAPIALGSASLLLLGASLGIFGLAVNYWRNIDSKTAMGNIKLAVDGLRETFGLELGKGDNKKNVFQRLGGGLMDIAMGILNFGSSFFIMGQLLLAGAALGLLYNGLKKWDNFNGVKAAKNLKIGIGAVKDAFGINDNKNKKEGIKGKLKKLGGKILDVGTSLLQGGEVLAKMATITIATGLADAIRLTLIPWRKFDAKPAAKNLKDAFGSLKDAFGLNDKNDNIGSKSLRLIGGPLELASTLMESGGVLVKMGTIMLATGLADVIKLNLKPWESYDGNNAVTHLGGTINSLKSLFGLDDRNDSLLMKPVNAIGDIFDLASTLLQSGGVFVKMGTITLATGLAGRIKDYIMPWENYTGTKKAITNIGDAINGLLGLFDIDELGDAEKEKGLLKKIGDMFKNIGQAAVSATDTIAAAAQSGTALTKIGAIASLTSILSSIHNNLSPWENFNTSKVASNITTPLKSTIDTVNALDMAKASTVVEIFKSFSNIKDKPIDAFTKAVDKFSESCSEFIDSLNDFNNSNNKPTGNKTSTENTNVVGVDINNKEEFAMAIANAIKSLPVNVRTDISDVKLVVNNEAGRRVVISLDN